MPSWDGPRILKAKSEGKLVVTDGHSYIYYGREANEWAKQWRDEHPDPSEGIPVEMIVVPEEHWEAFAEQFQLQDEGDG